MKCEGMTKYSSKTFHKISYLLWWILSIKKRILRPGIQCVSHSDLEQIQLLSMYFSHILCGTVKQCSYEGENIWKHNGLCIDSSENKPFWDLTMISVCTECLTVFLLKSNVYGNFCTKIHFWFLSNWFKLFFFFFLLNRKMSNHLNQVIKIRNFLNFR